MPAGSGSWNTGRQTQPSSRPSPARSSSSGSQVFTGAEQAVAGPVTIDAPTGEATATGLAPAITVTAAQTVGTATAAGLAPGLAANAPAPAAAATASAASAALTSTLTAPAGGAAAASDAPTARATITSPAAEGAAAGDAPAVQVGQAIIAPTGASEAAVDSPTLSASVFVETGTASADADAPVLISTGGTGPVTVFAIAGEATASADASTIPPGNGPPATGEGGGYGYARPRYGPSPYTTPTKKPGTPPRQPRRPDPVTLTAAPALAFAAADPPLIVKTPHMWPDDDLVPLLLLSV